MTQTQAFQETAALPSPHEASLFLDFDGTLVALADTPEAITISPKVPLLLQQLDTTLQGRLAIVSGRDLASLERYLDIPNLTLVGGHGAQCRGLKGVAFEAKATQAALAEVIPWARGLVAEWPGVQLEEKPTGLALHYRQAPDFEERVKEAARKAAQRWSGFEVQRAHMAVELKPKGASKANALGKLMARTPFEGTSPIFVGDDRTDIAAIDWCLAHGGAGIAVGGLDVAATVHLDTPACVLTYLERWLDACPD